MPWAKVRELTQPKFRSAKKLREEWVGNTVLHKNLIRDPTQRVKGFKLSRQEFVVHKRLKAGLGRCGHMMYKWKLKNSQKCGCGNDSHEL
ncbi:unnamed protein product [Macrosiphum euphorbiae]|uniref:Uncharacterized protein n=1 Tax=Macrosiphum euphorbiae TaxID=13131 RepID=A0AAV0W2X8_9HEMI|nr:unnamed protein product [Macrosiphum euphorbiae]